MKDRDMQLRLGPELLTVVALTFEKSNPPKYQYVFNEQDGKALVNIKLKKELNVFLAAQSHTVGA